MRHARGGLPVAQHAKGPFIRGEFDCPAKRVCSMKYLIRITSMGALVAALLLTANGCVTKSASRAFTETRRLDDLRMNINFVGAESGRSRYRAGYASRDREQELLALYNGTVLPFATPPSYFNIAILNSGEVSRLRNYLNDPGRVSLRKPFDKVNWEPHYELRIQDGKEKYCLDIGYGRET